MRVLHISLRADRGGGPENILRLISQFGKGFDHFVACPRELPYWERYGDLIGADHLVELPHRSLGPLALFRVARFCRLKQIQLIHSHGFGAGLYSRPLGQALSVPVLHTFHGFHLHREGVWQGPVKLAAERLLQPFTTHSVAVSASEGQAVTRALRISANRMSVIANGVDTERYVPAQPRDGSAFIILAAGRLSAEKNPLDLIRILYRLRRRRPDSSAVLHIAGGGPLHGAMEAEIRRLALIPYVRLSGWIDDMLPQLQSASAYLSASRGEGLSLGMLEAMSCGLPVVATAVQGHTDIVIPGQTGFLFEEGDIDKAADALYRLERDASLWNALSCGARNLMVSGFSISRCVNLHEQLFGHLTGSPAGQPDGWAANRS